jgi:hypothetical protein
MSEDIYAPLETNVFGYLPDPPKAAGEQPDWSFTEKLRPALKIVWPGDVDLSPHTTSTNQYSAGSCAGNATADSVEVLNSIEGLAKVELSRLFVYTLARNFMDVDLDGKSDIDKDDGTYIRLCFDVLSKFGICREDLAGDKGGWPYDLSKLHVLPSLKAMRAATGHRIHSYYRIDETGQDRVDAILAALRGNHPVVFGTSVTRAFTQLRDAGPVAPPEGEATIGGHAMMLCGYDRTKGFLMHNSWGTGWGDGGFAYLTEDYLAWDGTGDIWVPTKGTVFR